MSEEHQVVVVAGEQGDCFGQGGGLAGDGDGGVRSEKDAEGAAGEGLVVDEEGFRHLGWLNPDS